MELTFEQLPAEVARLAKLVEEVHRHVTTSAKTEVENSFLTVKETSELLNLTIPTLYGLTQRKGIPHCKRGKRLYFSRNELVEWVKSGRKATDLELSRIAETNLANQLKRRPVNE